MQDVDGHNVADILAGVDRAGEIHAQPKAIIARTTKGRGVGFMEYDQRWHGTPPTKEEYERAKAQLEEGMRKWRL